MFLSDLSIARPVLAITVAVAMIVFGLISYKDLNVDLMPDVEFPVVTVTTVFPGADPATVESEVSKKIEEEVGTLAGIQELVSYSYENVSVLVVQFELETNLETAVQDVRDKLSRLASQFPDNVQPSVVEKFNFSSSPVISVAVSSEGTPQDLSNYVKNVIKPQLERVNGVGRVDVSGLREREVRVWFDPNLMASFGVSAFDIVGALQRANVKFPGGRIETGDREYSVVTSGELQSVDEFNDVVVLNTDGKIVKLKDVARVEDGLADLRSESRLNGTEAVGIQVVKQSGANTVKVVDGIRSAIVGIQKELPPGIRITTMADSSVFIRDSFTETQGHVLGGGLLAIIIVLLFLGNFRTTIIAGLTIPTSIISTFIFMRLFGFTLNMLTMLAIALSVGMLIDDAIVVLENIYRHREKGEDRFNAAKSGSKEIAYAVLATTLSIVAVFIPVAFMTGIIGRFMYQYGITVTVAVASSYFVAITIAPMLASKFMTADKTPFILFKWFDAGFARLETSYKGLIRSALRRKGVTIVIAIACMVGALMLFKAIPSEFQSKMDDSAFGVMIEMPQGTSLAKLADLSTQVEGVVSKIPEVKNFFTTLGGGSDQSVNTGSITIDLVDKKERKRSKWQIMDDVRTKVSNYPGAKVIVAEQAGGEGGFSSFDLQFELAGSDLNLLNQTADKFIDVLKNTPGFRDLDKSSKTGKPELRINIDRERAADLGVDAMSLGTALNLMVSGEQAITTYKENGEQFDVIGRLASNFRDRPEDLLTLTVPGTKGNPKELTSFVTIARVEGPAQIERSKGQRRVVISANLDIPLGNAVTIVKGHFTDLVPPGISVRMTGMADMMRESFESMGFSMLLAVLLIYLILAAQYEHFVFPLSIMMTVPMAFIGAFGLLFITQMSINIISMMGIIMLMGLVTKNAILVVDFTNQLRAKGMPRDEALMEAGPIRLRPVLMTTFATIGGMLPVALKLGGGAGTEMKAPMAVAVIGGLITSTLLTLVVVPVMYALLDSATVWIVRNVFRVK